MRPCEETIETLYTKLKEGGSDISLERIKLSNNIILRKIGDLQNMLAENEITKEEYWASIVRLRKKNEPKEDYLYPQRRPK